MLAVTMQNSVPPAVRPARRVRLVEHAKGISVYPEPYNVPVLPPGWAPLDGADQEAVLNACDAHEHACRLRFGSPWDSSIEYRVYALDADAWQGVCAATVFTTGRGGTISGESGSGNTRLLAIGRDVQSAARVAIDFLNWDLEAEGVHWRVALTSVAPIPRHS